MATLVIHGWFKDVSTRGTTVTIITGLGVGSGRVVVPHLEVDVVDFGVSDLVAEPCGVLTSLSVVPKPRDPVVVVAAATGRRLLLFGGFLDLESSDLTAGNRLSDEQIARLDCLVVVVHLVVVALHV